MNARRRWFLLLLGIGLLSATGLLESLTGEARILWAEATSRQATVPWRMKKVDDSVASIVYEVPHDHWLTFDVPAGLKVLKVVTNGDLPLAAADQLPTPLPEDVRWPYALQYQVVDRAGNVLADRDYHHRTRLTKYHDGETGDAITGLFYLNEELVPSDSRTLLINLTELPGQADRLRLRVQSLESPLTGIVVRVYGQDEISEYKLRYLWQRLPEDRKERIARGNVYSPELLKENERRSLLRQQLAPIAPQGIAGRDYRQRHLYVLNDNESEPIHNPQPPAGLLADRDRRAVVPLPEQGGLVTLEFQAIQPKEAAPTASIEVAWQGRGLSQRGSRSVAWNGVRAELREVFGGGLLEVRAPEALVVRAYLSATDSRAEPAVEITPKPMFVWGYLLDGDTPIEIDVLHDSQGTTLFRLDLRQFPPTPDTPIPTALPTRTVSCEMLDARGRLLRKVELTVDQPPSVYDRLQTPRQELVVSDPSSCYFHLPPEVARLRFPPVAAPVLVTAYNRPGGLVKATAVPEDYFAFNRDEVGQRSWFLVRACRHDSAEVQARTPLMLVQSRPQVDDPDMLAGVYQWLDLLPEGAWRARHLLTTRDPAAVFRPEALPVTFRELALDQDVSVTFQVLPGLQECAPSLMYVSDAAGQGRLKVFFDGRLHHEASANGTRGEVLLPPLRPGAARTVRVTASRPLRVFLNSWEPGSGSAVVKRLALRLDNSPLEFTYEKTSADEEFLSLTLFGPPGDVKRTQLKARLEAPQPTSQGPHPDWTLRQRRFDVRLSGGQPGPVLGTTDENVDQGQVFYFPVAKDVPPGRYRLVVERTEGPGGYLIVSHTIPGAYERRQFFLEKPSGGAAVFER